MSLISWTDDYTIIIIAKRGVFSRRWRRYTLRVLGVPVFRFWRFLS